MTSRPLRVLVCPQEFKGTLTPEQAAAAIAAGVREALPNATVLELPMADGGPGTVDLVARATGATLIRYVATGPLGDPVEAAYALLDRPGLPPLAVIEAAAAAGLLLIPPERRDPGRASSAGLGEQIRHALDRGAREVTVGVGGTATNDGGSGAATALGLRLLDANGIAIGPGGLALRRLARIEDARPPAVREPALRIAVDVQNPLLGATGATAVYGAQKGVRDWQAPALNDALTRWTERLRIDLGSTVAAQPGAGAGGGIPTGLLAACPHGRIESGAALVGEAIGLRAAIEQADLVITGEGSMDGQTSYGKAVAHVAALAAQAGRPCMAVAGVVGGRPTGVIDAEPLATGDADRTAALERPAEYAAAAAARLVHRWRTTSQR